MTTAGFFATAWSGCVGQAPSHLRELQPGHQLPRLATKRLGRRGQPRGNPRLRDRRCHRRVDLGAR
eukprot:5179117-Pyramimonas_sp.AAC.1